MSLTEFWGHGVQPFARENCMPGPHAQIGVRDVRAVSFPTAQRQVDWSSEGSIKSGHGRQAWPVL